MTRQRVEHLSEEAHARYRRGEHEGWVKVECGLCLGCGQVFPPGHDVLVTCGRCLGCGHCYERVLDMKPTPAHDAYAAALAAEERRLDVEEAELVEDLWDAEPIEPTC